MAKVMLNTFVKLFNIKILSIYITQNAGEDIKTENLGLIARPESLEDYFQKGSNYLFPEYSTFYLL